MSADASPVARLRAAADRLEDLAKRAAFGWGAEWTARNADEGDLEWSVVDSDGKRDMVGSEDGDITALIATMDPATVYLLAPWLRSAARNVELAMSPTCREFGESTADQAARVAGDHVHSLAFADAVLASAPREETTGV
jgi:hypothetical protein